MITRVGMLRILAVMALAVIFAGSALADGIPLDPRAGVAGGGTSMPITGTTFSFTLTPCFGPGTPEILPAECTGGAFVNPQAVFSGVNQTGIPWTYITITLDFPMLTSDQLFFCDGGTLFTVNNCPSMILAGATQVTFTLFKGNGDGIGCYNSGSSEADFACLINAINALNPPSDLPFFQFDSEEADCQANPLQVCGPAHFVIGVGFDGDVWTDGAPTGGTATVPEPGTLGLALAGMGALALLRRRKQHKLNA